MDHHGFTIVFRMMTQRPGAAERGLSSIPSAPATDSIARTLIRKHQAEPVLETGDTRELLIHDPILSDVYVVNGGDMGTTAQLLDQLQSDAAVQTAYVAPPRDLLPTPTPSSPSGNGTGTSWRDQIRLAQASALPQWKVREKVAVTSIDSGIDTVHAQLQHMEFVEYLSAPPVRTDAVGHGSHVAGLIAGAPNAGNEFMGIAHDCVEFGMYRAFQRPREVAAYYRALRAAGSARILNLSAGGEGEDELETELIAAALAADCIVVAAMGNARHIDERIAFPAALPGVIAVGAVDATGCPASFSSSGDHIMLAAPGVDILSTVPTYFVPGINRVGTPPLGAMSGTSMATPIVSGVIARMVAYQPTLTRSQVIDLIEDRLSGSWNPDTGHGIVDAHALLSAL